MRIGDQVEANQIWAPGLPTNHSARHYCTCLGPASTRVATNLPYKILSALNTWTQSLRRYTEHERFHSVGQKSIR